MLIGLGLIVLAILFGSPQNDLLLTQIGKYAKKEIVEKDRRDIVLTEIKAVKQIQKDYGKTTKKHKKAFEKLVNNHATTQAEYDAFIVEMADYERKVNSIFIPHRIVVQKALTQQELDEIVISAKKDVQKASKSTTKKLKAFKKILEKNKKNLIKHFDNSEVEELSLRLDDFNKKAYQYGEDILTYDPTEEELLLNKEATAEDLLKVIDANVEQWKKLLNAFTHLNTELAKVVSEDDWKSVAKELNKLY